MAGILLATDGSEYAELAAERAIDLAREQSVPLHVLCVVDRREFGESALSSGELACIQVEDHGHECVAAVADEAENLGIDVVTDVCHGIPEDDIVGYAEAIDADRIVLGKHGNHREHLGGVGRRVEANSSRDTLVVSP
jgi:nucleotide-binding universal stress UspA family protein